MPELRWLKDPRHEPVEQATAHAEDPGSIVAVDVLDGEDRVVGV